MDWRAIPYGPLPYTTVPPRPSLKSLYLAGVLFLLTLCTCLVAGTQFAVAYAQNQAVAFDEFVSAFTLFYRHPVALAAGLPFALTLLTILLAHELGHFFACRHHHIRSSYPFFIPFPSLMGTFGAFILIRSPIRTTRALFDVGASGPLVGFLLAVPALAYGVLHAKIVPGLDDTRTVDLLNPIGRAAWVGLFATSLNLLPVAQLDGGHILRSLDPRLHLYVSMLLPLALLSLGLFGFWQGWYVWGILLLGMRFLRIPPIYDPTPLDPLRRLGAFLALLVFLLCFMPAPLYFSPNPR
ncbi:MAG: hypothetical protein DMG46_09985 [Acidobacteria bacterium]|nr:MAG: hypothetical protein DMG46_09985 [Acidobacteriota bacterium]